MRCSNLWGHYVWDFVTLAWLLHRLTEKGSLSHWTPACEQAFAELKGLLVSAPILAFRDFLTPFILDTEASSNGFGAVLSQFGDDGTEHVVAYGSCSLSKPERQCDMAGAIDGGGVLTALLPLPSGAPVAAEDRPLFFDLIEEY